jgi:hypothetical protein
MKTGKFSRFAAQGRKGGGMSPYATITPLDDGRVSLKIKREGYVVLDMLYGIPRAEAQAIADKINAGAPFRKQSLWCRLRGHKRWYMESYGDWCWTCFREANQNDQIP